MNDNGLSNIAYHIRRGLATGAINFEKKGFFDDGCERLSARTKNAALEIRREPEIGPWKQGPFGASEMILRAMEPGLRENPEETARFLSDVLFDDSIDTWAALRPTGNGMLWPDAIANLAPGPDTFTENPWNRFWPVPYLAMSRSFDGESMARRQVERWLKEHPGMLLRFHKCPGHIMYYGWCTPLNKGICFQVVEQDITKPWQVTMEPDNETGRMMEQIRSIRAAECLDRELNLYRYLD